MRDFALDSGFLRSCIDLPRETREKIVSRLQTFIQGPRDRELGLARVGGSNHVLSLPVDAAYRILLRREKPVITLLLVTENDSPSPPVISNRGITPDHMVIAPVDALDTLLVEEKYLLLAKHLLKIPAATGALQFKISEIEEILNAHLPPEARQFHNWWANQRSGKRAQAFAWMAAGWVVSKADIKADLVKFTRQNLRGGGVR
jgi:hypothetical protein